MLTVDTEALPKRASEGHVTRLIWGEHEKGTAGVREMCAAADDVNSKLTFFVDACGAYAQIDEVAAVVRWLDAAGQDVQLHAHPEYLPEQFWKAHGFKYQPRFLNQYGAEKAAFTIKHFGKFISDLTGKPLRAFRAGSFRWNADTVRSLAEAGIPLSFNNSMRALADGQCIYSEPTNQPYLWSNGIIEVPVTERHVALPIIGKSWWQKFQFPVGDFLGNRPWRVLRPYTTGGNDASFLVLLLHSWSLLYWDKNGHAVYRDDKRVEDFHKLMRRLSKDYDIITTAEFLDLHAQGKITTTHTVDLARVVAPQVPAAPEAGQPAFGHRRQFRTLAAGNPAPGLRRRQPSSPPAVAHAAERRATQTRGRFLRHPALGAVVLEGSRRSRMGKPSGESVRLQSGKHRPVRQLRRPRFPRGFQRHHCQHGAGTAP